VTTAHEVSAVREQYTRERTAARDTALRVTRAQRLPDYQVSEALRQANLPASGPVTLGDDFDPELYNERGLELLVQRLTAAQQDFRTNLQRVVDTNSRHLGSGAQEILTAAGITSGSASSAGTDVPGATRVITLSISVSGADHITTGQIQAAAADELSTIITTAEEAGFTVHTSGTEVRPVR
jgi:hypothetical protein